MEGAGVASRWRIRHKLMLGLGLVVTTMVLLLGGTIFGVWSYYLDMKSLRGMTEQLSLADTFKTEVGNIGPLLERKMGRKEFIEPLRADDKKDAEASGELQLPPLPDDPGNDPKRDDKPPQTIEEALQRANKALERYEKDLLDHDNYLPAERIESAVHYIRALRDNLKTLRQKIESAADADANSNKTGIFHLNEPDVEVDRQQQKQWAALLARIARDTRDLRDNIDAAIGKRIYDSRGKYQTTLWITVTASIVGLLLIIGMLGSFYAWVFHPIRDLEAGVNRVAKGDFDHRIEVHSGDEMEDLGAAFNDMMRRLQDLYGDLARQVNERSRQLVRSERLASVGFLAAGVAHEINNPLASIAFCSEALEARLNDLLRHLRANSRFDEEHEIFSKYLKMIQEEAFRCKNITERLLAFSRPGERRREKTDLRELVQLVLDVTQHLPNHRGKEIQFEMNAERLAAGEPIFAWVNGEEIKSVVLNLVVNALDSVDEGGKLTIRLAQRGDMAELQFTDNGCGMTQEVLENIFEPFYTRSRTGKGTGLGLTITHRIITQHGGEIEAMSAGPQRGSTFIVRLPVSAEATPLLPASGTSPGKNEEQAATARAA
jgi:two-component system NtrC family sensor kinase